ncbi:MAG: 4Fe-4S binding protein [Proteobacteria bacterium]|nr:4Fe-4S binding protein [Pseudomonadota bacterium]MBU1741651.1 4Fe-4S binding protein [Pseudomonadota bacterium]
MKAMVYLPNVVTLALDADRCTGCGGCLEVCPHEVLAVEDGRARIVRRDACMECGACATNCPFEAIAVQSGVGCAAAVIKSALGRRPVNEAASGCC